MSRHASKNRMVLPGFVVLTNPKPSQKVEEEKISKEIFEPLNLRKTGWFFSISWF
jgi:hypothetical protein